MTTVERRREGVVFRWILLGLVIMVAISFGWLFYDQYQRSNDNHVDNVRLSALVTRLAADEVTLSTTVHSGCKSGNDLRRTLKTLLLTIQHFPSPVPVTPQVVASEQRLYAILIAQIKLRPCTPTKGHP